MNTSYLIYQAERTKTAAEQRAIDRSAGELAASLARRWHALAALSKGQLLRRGHDDLFPAWLTTSFPHRR